MTAIRTALIASLLASLGVVSGCQETGLEPYADSGVSSAAGNIEDRMELTPIGTVEFGRVATDGTSSSQEVILTNVGSQQLPVIDVYMDEFTASAFFLPDELPLPLMLKPGASFTLDVYFKPYAVSEFTGTVIIELDDGDEVYQASRALLGFGCEEGQAPANGGC